MCIIFLNFNKMLKYCNIAFDLHFEADDDFVFKFLYHKNFGTVHLHAEFNEDIILQ